VETSSVERAQARPQVKPVPDPRDG